MVVNYLILLFIALIAITAPDIYAVYSGVHLNRTVTMIAALVVVYVAWFLIMPRAPKK